MAKKFEITQGGFGYSCGCDEDDPYGGILQNELLRGAFPTDSHDNFWLKIRNR